jgi:glycosyltransferase involved in cell wall biosynthesis
MRATVMSLRGRSLHTPEPQIVWDGLGLDSPNSGIGHYGKCLHEALAELGESAIVTSLVGSPTIINRDKILYIPHANTAVPPSKRKLSPARIYGLKPVFPSLSYKVAARSYAAMIYHGLSNLNLPCFTKRRQVDRFVLTIHDLIPMIVGGPSVLSVQMRVLMPRVVRMADAIIVPSNWTKNSLIDRFGESVGNKITVIPNGTADLGDELSENPHKEKTNDVLAVGRGEGYKRLHLVAALAQASPQTRFILVTDDFGARRVGVPPANLKVLTKISRQQLVEAYSTSRVFIHPSLYEGWCLPAADAIKAGLTTIFVKGTGIEEVCAYAPGASFGLDAGAGLDQWQEVLSAVLANKANSTANGGKLGLPTWGENAEKTLKIYQSLL